MISCLRFATPRRGAVLFSAAVLLLHDWLGASTRTAQAQGLLVSRDDAARNGLERVWFAQVAVDPSRSRVTSWLLYFGRIYGVTDSGIVTALNAETGATLWTKQIGRPGDAAFGPGANAEHLAIVTANRLTLMNRETGRMLWTRELGSAPAAGPALSREYAYVAHLNGRIEGFPLDDPNGQPWYFQSDGRIYHRPTTTGRVVSWPTSKGTLYVSEADDPGVRFQLTTGEDIVTSPAEMDPWLLIGSLDGYLYAINEASGRESWRFSAGYPIASSPAIVGGRAFVASLEPALYAVGLEKGLEQWMAVGASHFAAQGKDRVYAADRMGNLLVLDLKTGAQLGQIRTTGGMKTLVNDQSDRIYLISNRGLVQCLRESGAVEPTMYRQPYETEQAARAAAAAGAEDGESPFADEEQATDAGTDDESAFDDGATDEGSPFGDVEEDAPADEAPAEDETSPFAPEDEGEALEDDNPFE